MSFAARSHARDRALFASPVGPTLAITALSAVTILLLALIGLAQNGSLTSPSRGTPGVQSPRLSAPLGSPDVAVDLAGTVDLEPVVQFAELAPLTLPTSAATAITSLLTPRTAPESSPTASGSRDPQRPPTTGPPVVVPPTPVDPPTLGRPTAKDCRRALGHTGMRIPRRCASFCVTFVSSPGDYVPSACQRWCRAPFWAYRWPGELRPWCTAPGRPVDVWALARTGRPTSSPAISTLVAAATVSAPPTAARRPDLPPTTIEPNAGPAVPTPVTPEPGTPVTPEPVTPAPEPVTPVTPEPVTPEPVTPETQPTG